VETNVAAASAWFQFLCLFELHLLGKNSKTEDILHRGEVALPTFVSPASKVEELSQWRKAWIKFLTKS
jgi:hypothetical protein